MYLILLGAPGSGKGTQGEPLSHHLGVGYVASGDLFRKAQQEGTPLGLLAKSYMEQGKLVPDDVTISMILERLAASDCANGCVLDGFPRTVEQARALDSGLASRRKTIHKALYIRVSEAELVRRLSGRWICRNCQALYHETNFPPQVAGRCDRCGGELYQRADDRAETVAQRLRVYLSQTEPLIDYYRSQSKLAEVEGEQNVEGVAKALKTALK
ncbi:MAG: adenylate kinase [Chloroflexi bacterium]|nr:adenylate kinase [Chloroflexota bacterium]